MATGSEEKGKDRKGKRVLKSSWGLGFPPVCQPPAPLPGPELTVSKWERVGRDRGRRAPISFPASRAGRIPALPVTGPRVLESGAFSDVQGPCSGALASPRMPDARLGGWELLPTES